MGRIVILAEKPSVGRDIARVLGCRERGDGCLMNETYIVTWAVGHLVTLVEPDELDPKYKKWSVATLPILPKTIPLKVISSSRQQFKIVKNLICDKDTDSLICATDAGREGELIFRYIYEKSDCHKPFQRLWISSMTDEAIHEGFRTLKDGASYDGLYRSAKCRSEADWLVGMNASRAFTLRYNVLLSVGRVQTPTLAILVRRHHEIENFKPEYFATVTAAFGDYTGLWFSKSLDPDTHIPSKETAEAVRKKVTGKTGTVIKAETVRKKDPPPQLYDLTTLQRDANKLLGYTADKTLKLAQSLYETHKALTYPRTDSRYLPPDMIPKVQETLKNLPHEYQSYLPLSMPEGKIPVTKRTIDASKVTDHHAIIPTPRTAQMDKMTQDERALFDLVARRTLAAFAPGCEYDATTVITQVEDETFRSNGRVILQPGFKAIPATSAPPRKSKSKSSDNDSEKILPPLQEGDTRTCEKTTLKEDMTKPPPLHTDASLLSAMENAGKELDDEELQKQMKGSGIGTPATRAAIIERIIHVGYARRSGKSIAATDKGIQMIGIMPDELTSAELTGKWEQALDKIADNTQDPVRFMEGIERFSAFLVDYAREKSPDTPFPEEAMRGKGGKRSAGHSVHKDLTCPLCQKGHIEESPMAFSCTQPRTACAFTLWKDCLTKSGGPMITEKLLRLILEKKRLQGSTGTIELAPPQIRFYPLNPDTPSLSRLMEYHPNKKA